MAVVEVTLRAGFKLISIHALSVGAHTSENSIALSICVQATLKVREGMGARIYLALWGKPALRARA